MSPRVTFSPIKTLILGLISGGLIPLLALPKLFRDFVIAERAQLWHFAEWLRLQYPGAETEKFQQAISHLKFRWSPYILSIVLAALAVAWAWHDVSRLSDGQVTPAFLFAFTARLPHIVNEFATLPRVLIAAQGFALLLIAAHVLSIWQIVRHVHDVGAVVGRYNVVAKKHQLPAIVAPRFELQWTIVWIVCMLAPAIIGAWWSFPMMLAASAQWRYINRTGRAMRLALAANAFNALASRKPPADVMLPGALQGKCVRDGCDKLLPIGSGFCPRCGSRVVASIDLEF